jgi:hypothetical protein
MCKKARYFNFLLTVTTFCAFCPLYTIAQDKQKTGFEIEADPLAYVLKGYSLHAAVTYNNFRTSIGTFAIDQPDFFTGNKAISVYSSGFDLKTDYLFKKINGMHAGLQVTYGKERIGLKTGGDKQDLWGMNIGARIGYRFMFGKPENNYQGFYINPWIALIYSPDPKNITKGVEEYRQSSILLFPAVHVGWRF